MARKDKKKAKPKKVPVPPGGWQAKKGIKTTPKINPDVTKTVPSLDLHGDEINQRRLVWRLGFHDDDGDWALSSASRNQMVNLLDKLVSYESMKVGEIFSPDSEHGKAYEVASMPPHAQERLREIGHDDEDKLHRLRCSGVARLYGIMRENVFHILWWDPEHQVWPSAKRNT